MGSVEDSLLEGSVDFHSKRTQQYGSKRVSLSDRDLYENLRVPEGEAGSYLH